MYEEQSGLLRYRSSGWTVKFDIRKPPNGSVLHHPNVVRFTAIDWQPVYVKPCSFILYGLSLFFSAIVLLILYMRDVQSNKFVLPAVAQFIYMKTNEARFREKSRIIFLEKKKKKKPPQLT